MENVLNIDQTQFKDNDEKFYLADPAIYVRLLSEIGWSYYPLGFMEMEKNWAQKLEYAVFETGIPSVRVRKDPIKQEFTFEGKLKQLQLNAMALISQRTIDDSNPASKRIIMGTDLPPALFLPICKPQGFESIKAELLLILIFGE